MRRILIFAVVLMLTGGTQAAEPAAQPFMGRWTPDPKQCESGNFHWTFSPTEAFNEGFTCLSTSYKRTGSDRWTMRSSDCNNEESHFADREQFTVRGDVLKWQGKSYYRCPDAD